MTIYTKTGCPWCVDAINFLKQNRIAFEEVNVSSDKTAMKEMIELSGQSKAPTLEYNGAVLADFGVEELIPFLQKHEII